MSGLGWGETHFSYDAKGRLSVLTDAAGQRWQLAYNGQQPTSLTGPDGLVWKTQHDARGNPLSVTGADGATTRFVNVHSKTFCHPAKIRLTVTSHFSTRGYHHEKAPYARAVASPD